MIRNSTRLYWMTNENWYRINEEKDCFELTNGAPARAVRSFNGWNKPKRKTSKFVLVNCILCSNLIYVSEILLSATTG